MEFDDRPEAAKRLEQARIKAGFATASAAAEFFGWNYATYSQHERGERGIPRAAKKYAKAFKVSEGWLLAGDVAPVGDDWLEELRALFPRINELGREALLASARAMASQGAEPAPEDVDDPLQKETPKPLRSPKIR